MRELRGAAVVVLLALAAPLASGAVDPARSEDRAASPAVAGKLPPAPCRRSAFRAVVDVGHTVAVPGAISARGVPEYTFNLQLATEIKQKLVDSGFEKTVLLIVGRAPPSGLLERAMVANRMRADLFISIHHDSVPDYLLEDWDYNGQPNHFSDRFKGYALFISNDNPEHAASLQFGRFLGKELQARGLQYTPHYTLPLMGNRQRLLVDAKAGVYRYDELVVLRRTHMPALLLEAGSIVNREEEVELASPERRARISAAVAAAVEDFCRAQTPPKIPPGSRPDPASSAMPVAR